MSDLRPPSFDVGFDGFVSVIGVDEDEVEFSVVEAAGGFDRWQPDWMPAVGVDYQMAERDRQSPVKRLRIAQLLDVIGAWLLGVGRECGPGIDAVKLQLWHEGQQIGSGDAVEDTDLDSCLHWPVG